MILTNITVYSTFGAFNHASQRSISLLDAIFMSVDDLLVWSMSGGDGYPGYANKQDRACEEGGRNNDRPLQLRFCGVSVICKVLRRAKRLGYRCLASWCLYWMYISASGEVDAGHFWKDVVGDRFRH